MEPLCPVPALAPRRVESRNSSHTLRAAHDEAVLSGDGSDEVILQAAPLEVALPAIQSQSAVWAPGALSFLAPPLFFLQTALIHCRESTRSEGALRLGLRVPGNDETGLKTPGNARQAQRKAGALLILRPGQSSALWEVALKIEVSGDFGHFGATLALLWPEPEPD